MNYYEARGNQTIIRFYIQPGASKNEFVGFYGEPPRIKLKIKAQPKDNEANKEFIMFVAELLKISKSQVEILRGETSRQKDILVNMESEEVRNIFTSSLKI